MIPSIFEIIPILFSVLEPLDLPLIDSSVQLGPYKVMLANKLGHPKCTNRIQMDPLLAVPIGVKQNSCWPAVPVQSSQQKGPRLRPPLIPKAMGSLSFVHVVGRSRIIHLDTAFNGDSQLQEFQLIK